MGLKCDSVEAWDALQNLSVPASPFTTMKQWSRERTTALAPGITASNRVVEMER